MTCGQSLHRGLTFFAKRLEVKISSPVREASLHQEHMYGSSLDCNGLQPIQHLLKSLSRESTDLQYCDWLRSRRNDVIHSEQGLYLYEAHGARQIPENNLKVRYYILALKTFIKRQESYIGYILH